LIIRFTPSARFQLLEAQAYIQRDNPEATRKFRERTETVLRRLVDYPESGRLVPEFPELPYREVINYPYRLFYRAEGKTIWIVAVWHGAQKVEKPPGIS
jgi:plasmid stabilization system protein ParE